MVMVFLICIAPSGSADFITASGDGYLENQNDVLDAHTVIPHVGGFGLFAA